MRIRMLGETFTARTFLAERPRVQTENPAPHPEAEVQVEICHDDEHEEVKRLVVTRVKMNPKAPRGRRKDSQTYTVEGRLTYDVNRPGEDAGDNPQESRVRIKSYHPQSGGKVNLVEK